MVRRIADQYEVMAAGLKRLEEERLRRLNGADEMPELPPIEAYEGYVNYDNPQGVQATIQANSTAPFVGELQSIGYGMFLVWNGKAWVSEEEWQDKGIQK